MAHPSYNKELLNQSITGAVTSSGIDVGRVKDWAITMVTSSASSPVGITVTVQVSNDYVTQAEDVVNWFSTSITQALSADTVYMVEDENIGYKWLRISVSYTSGSISADIRFNGHECS